MDYTMNGRVASRDGNRDHFMAPDNCYRCKGNDRWISICVSNDEEWQALCKAIGEPEWTKDERFSDQLSRWTHQEALDSLIEQWTSNHTHYEAMDILQKEGVAAMPSLTAEDIYGDPHLADRQFADVLEHTEIGAHLTILPPWRLSGTPQQIVRDAPCLGEHNQYVYGEVLGMSEEEIRKLTEEKVIY
jgi:benzylsuccinate CoA-transferase BbsF subunit